MFDKVIKVKFEVFSTSFSIQKKLKELAKIPMLSFDLEVQSKYSLDERAEAKLLLKESKEEMTGEDVRLCEMVARSSGLSYPKITKVTHVIFGLSRSESIIFIINDPYIEKQVLTWVGNYKGKLLVHNALFDMKIVLEKTGKIPKDIEDTQLLARTLINHTNSWDCKTGLKHLMSEFYNPSWTLIESYDIQDYKDEAFLRYSAIDGAATYKLYQDLMNSIKIEKED